MRQECLSQQPNQRDSELEHKLRETAQIVLEPAKRGVSI
jgi:hypothetical protein